LSEFFAVSNLKPLAGREHTGCEQHVNSLAAVEVARMNITHTQCSNVVDAELFVASLTPLRNAAPSVFPSYLSEIRWVSVGAQTTSPRGDALRAHGFFFINFLSHLAARVV
jgi:hypothetical protein